MNHYGYTEDLELSSFALVWPIGSNLSRLNTLIQFNKEPSKN